MSSVPTDTWSPTFLAIERRRQFSGLSTSLSTPLAAEMTCMSKLLRSLPKQKLSN